MKHLFIISFIVFSNIVFAAEECTYKIDSENVQVSWTAFKTPKKIGVGGSFTKLGIANEYQGNTLAEALKTVKFSIDTNSVSTKNDDRDAKIVKFFFKAMKKGMNITGSIKDYSQKTIMLNLKMNGVTKEVPLIVDLKDDQIKADGVIDLFDFSMKKSLTGINKACLELHEGKTWNDVSISLQAKFSKACK